MRAAALLLASALASRSPAIAQEPSARDIVDRVETLLWGRTIQGEYEMTLFAGRIQNVGRRYFGAYAGYEITPLVKTVNYLVVNLADRSRFFSPTVIVSLHANLDLSLGVQYFGGSPGSEYARLRDLYFAQVQWFF